MRVDLLGPIRVRGEHTEIVLKAAKERSLLAALALRPGSVVSTEALIGTLWGEAPPDTARKTLQTYISNLRRSLGSEVIGTESWGYVLRLSPDWIDVGRFRALIQEATEANRRGSTERARRLLGDAVALWRGDPFAGVAPHTTLAGEAIRLKEEYLSALEARVDADLACGRHAEIVGELELLTAEHPFRERLWGQLMLALYRAGRQAEALAAYQRARQMLRDELGLEPGGELRGLEQAILDHDPLLPVPAANPTGSDHPRPPVLRSPVRYAITDDGVHVAYQVIGDGPVDILVVPAFVCHLDLWSEPPVDQLVRGLGVCGRVIIFDKRGSGLSDRPPDIRVDDWIMDVRAVLDAVGSERTVLVGVHCGSPIAAMFAAAYPDRTSALVMFGAAPRNVIDDDYPFGLDPESVASFSEYLEANWGAGGGLSAFAPSAVRDSAARAFWARYQRLSASPSAVATFQRAITSVDARDALALVTAPTLVLHAARDAIIHPGAAQLMVERIPDATYVELDSDIHLIWFSDVIPQITDEITSFIARVLPCRTNERTLTTVLAMTGTDISRHCADVAAIVERHRGRQQEPRGTVTFERPSRAIECGLELASQLHAGAAIHAGECELLANGDITGPAVTISTQLASVSSPGQVLVTNTIRDLLFGSDIEFEQHSRQCLDAAPAHWDIHTVKSR